MNMPALNIEKTNVSNESSAVQGNSIWKSAFELFENEQAVFQMLDSAFPLHERSHKEVKQYVVYFRHLMVFFEDGSHCGLENASQFVAFTGGKESPTSLLLQDKDSHIELTFDKRQAKSLSKLSDVFVEFPMKREFTTPDGQMYLV